MTLLQASQLAEVLAAVSAVALARRRPAHTPAAVSLVLLAVVALLGEPVSAALTPVPVEPWQGWSLVLVYLDGALNLATSATIAGLAIAVAVSPERRRLALATVAGVWLLVSVVLGALYPSPIVRGDGLQRVYFAADLIGIFVSTVAIIVRTRAQIAAKRSPNGVDAVALGLVTLDALILLLPFSPWRGAVFGGSFAGIQLVITMFFATFTLAQVIAWKLSSRG